jgi:hypothetical protein
MKRWLVLGLLVLLTAGVRAGAESEPGEGREDEMHDRPAPAPVVSGPAAGLRPTAPGDRTPKTPAPRAGGRRLLGGRGGARPRGLRYHPVP